MSMDIFAGLALLTMGAMVAYYVFTGKVSF